MERPSLRWIALCLGLGSLALAGCGGKADIKIVGAPDTSSCGDETVDPDEKCDDGNSEDGDGCSKECQPEEGYVCVGKRNSSCAKTCGNEKLDEGEACEDGNTTAGDGCGANCQIEGSCEEPVVLDVSSGKASIDSSINGGGGDVPKADCDGSDSGDGPDRVFQFELTSAMDVTVSLSSSFNGLVRLSSAACDSSSELACANGEGAGSDENVVYRDVPAGTYYVVVDSVGATSKGDFTLEVALSCPISNLKLKNVAQSFAWNGSRVVELTNRAKNCSIDLGQFHIGTYVGYPTYGVVDVPLKKTSLGAGKSFRISSSADPGFTPDQVTNKLDFYQEMLVYVCFGTCSSNSSDNVLDLIHGGYEGSEPPPLPGEATFLPGPLTKSVGYYFMSWARKSYVGKNGKFVASDWVRSFDLDPEEIAAPQDYYKIGTPGGIAVIDDPAEEEGKILRVTAGASIEYQGYYISLPADFHPTTITVRMSLPAGSEYAGFGFGVGASSAIAYDGPLYHLTYPTYSYLYTPDNIQTDFDTSVWHDVVFDDIDWSVEPVTMSYSVNGVTPVNISRAAPVLDRFEFFSYYSGDFADFADVHATE